MYFSVINNPIIFLVIQCFQKIYYFWLTERKTISIQYVIALTNLKIDLTCQSIMCIYSYNLETNPNWLSNNSIVNYFNNVLKNHNEKSC